MRLGPIALMLLSAAACTEITAEREGTFEYRGDTLRAVTRDYSANGRTFTKRVIYDGPRRVSCSATDDLDCRAAISYERMDSND
ncbi:hypothetical protein [uncultured Tateyamaria sp.]|uniref:hypothetical protein n=1 Tax=uncultured Tateyamaria sp. TaxID=455651 RepID=UPI002618F790|nr:hypothetical protein [uncultured Tateyamaria sp.]